MNLGLEKMAESCRYTYRQLSWSIDWHIREETLLAALANLDNFVLSAPLSRAWGDGTTSSSDGMRMHMGVKAANAEYNAKYFGAGRGTNMYIHAADIWIPFGRPQIIGTNYALLQPPEMPIAHKDLLEISNFGYPFSPTWPYTVVHMQAAMTPGHPDLRPDIPDEQVLFGVNVTRLSSSAK